MTSLSVILSTLGVGGIFGWFTGIAVKTVSRLVGCLLGLVFILMQILAYYGLAEWHWEAISEFVLGPAAVAADTAAAKLWTILTYNLPFSGGFATGFYLGLRR
ncbi:MAG: FUN14 domain-containing protein [Armatimonadota bacterium]